VEAGSLHLGVVSLSLLGIDRPITLKVLHVVEATTAGVARHVLDLCRYMGRDGLDVAVACPLVRENAQYDTAFVSSARAEGVQVFEIPMRHGIRPLADLWECGRLVRLIGREEYDVVHTHSSKAGVLGRLAAWRCGVPVTVYTPNAFAFLGAPTRLQSWSYRAIERWLGWQFTDVLICVSQSEMTLAQQYRIAPTERLVLVENTVDAYRFAPTLGPAAARAALTCTLGINPARFVVGYVGRLARQKGLEYLIRAARQVVTAVKNIQFVLVGEGELERAVRQIVVKFHLEDRIMLAGYRPDIPQVLSALDVLVLPSLYEGLPYTLMEGMAAGCAVVATDVGGNRDLIQHGKTGLLIPPRDVNALADALIRLLLAPDEREWLGRAALAMARSRPAPEQTVRQTIRLYGETLEMKRSGPRTGPTLA
jgi:glycosyltransferase involved in cell wall biosynthesis